MDRGHVISPGPQIRVVQRAALASSAFNNPSFGRITIRQNNMRMVQFTFAFSPFFKLPDRPRASFKNVHLPLSPAAKK